MDKTFIGISNMIWNKLLFFFILILYECRHLHGLHLTHIIVPEVADVRDIITLSCSYNMGSHKLNSVKWYKDGSEFFRYTPMMIPNIMKFPVNGIHIASDQPNLCNRKVCSIYLDNLNTNTSGSYRCEISGDAPEFKLVHETGNMSIAVLPQHDPVISGLNRNYQINDFLVANCTSDLSSPPAVLSWYINDEKAPPEFLQPQQETTIESDGFSLQYRSLEIRFRIDKTRFNIIKGKLRLQCIAAIKDNALATRESTIIVYVSSPDDDLNNQKLIFWRSSAINQHSIRKMDSYANIMIVFINILLCCLYLKRV